MWIPTESDAIEMFARHYEALHRSGSAKRAEETAANLRAKGDYDGQRMWHAVAETVRRLRQNERVSLRRELEFT